MEYATFNMLTLTSLVRNLEHDKKSEGSENELFLKTGRTSFESSEIDCTGLLTRTFNQLFNLLAHLFAELQVKGS